MMATLITGNDSATVYYKTAHDNNAIMPHIDVVLYSDVTMSGN